MERQRGRIDADTIFPGIPGHWSRQFEGYLCRLSRRAATATAVALVVFLPVVQVIQTWMLRPAGDYALDHLAWRLPVFLLAASVVALWYYRPEGRWPRPLGLLLAVTMLASVTARFALGLAGGSPWVLHDLGLLLIVIMICSVLATRGVRDLVLIFGIPVAGFALYIAQVGVELGEFAVALPYPVLAMLISGYIAHILYGTYAENFLMQCRLHEHAMTDPLTGALNRRAMEEELHAARSAARRHQRQFALIMADLDHFKRVNDTHGHDVGDQVLVELTRRIDQLVRTEDRVARWGGEEFLVLLNTAGEDAAMAVADKVRQRIADTAFATDAGPLEITISLGVAVHCGEETVDAVIARADAALYRAKHRGRNCSVLDHTPVAAVVGGRSRAQR